MKKVIFEGKNARIELYNKNGVLVRHIIAHYVKALVWMHQQAGRWEWNDDETVAINRRG